MSAKRLYQVVHKTKDVGWTGWYPRIAIAQASIVEQSSWVNGEPSIPNRIVNSKQILSLINQRSNFQINYS